MVRMFRIQRSHNVAEMLFHCDNVDTMFSHSGEKSPLWDQVPTEAIWHSKLTFFLNVKFVFYKPYKYKHKKYLLLFDIF